MRDEMGPVTGTPGWLGTRFIEALAGSREIALGDESLAARVLGPGGAIRCLVLPVVPADPLRALAPGRMETREGDVRDPASLARFFEGAAGATAFHLAGIIHPARVSDFAAINFEGTRNVTEAAIRAGVRRLVVMSSNSPIGCNPGEGHAFDESAPYDPYMGYGRSKMRMERYLLETVKRGGIEIVIVRSPWFYGPRQPERQTLFFKMICGGRMPLVGSGRNRRSMAYVDNICQGLLLAGSAGGVAGEIFWIADERPYSMEEVIVTVQRLMRDEFGFTCSGRIPRLPGLASDIAWLFDYALQAAGIYHQKIHVLSEMNKNIACTVDKAKRVLGYRPVIDLEEGMRRSIRWCIEQGLLDAGGRTPPGGSRPADAARGAARENPASAGPASPQDSRPARFARADPLRPAADSRYGAVVAALVAAHSRGLLGEEPDEQAVRRVTAAVLHAVARMPWHLRVPMVTLTILFDAGAVLVQGKPFRRCAEPLRYLALWSGSRLRPLRDFVAFYESVFLLRRYS